MTVVRLLVGLLLVSCSAIPRFEAGVAAYNRQDYVAAREIWEPLAENGSPHAQYNLGLLYGEGQGTPKNSATAEKWLRAAASQGFEMAQYSLGSLLYKGHQREARQWFLRAAIQAHPKAQYNLGVMLEHGEGGPRNIYQAVSWYRRAADLGELDAAYNCAVLLEDLQKHEESFRFFLRVANQGDSRAEMAVGGAYLYGIGVPKDSDEAVRWLRKADEHGNLDATYQLGSYYRRCKKYLEAIGYLRRAGQGGSAVARCELGLMYTQGQGVQKNRAQARVLFIQAAEGGEPFAQTNLGHLYERGLGVPKDLVQAYKWYEIAAASNHPAAVRRRSKLSGHLTLAQRKLALQDASEWLSMHR